METKQKVIIAGNTPRWIEKAKVALPPTCEPIVCHDSIDIITTLEEHPDVALCVIANRMEEANEGLRVARELSEPGDPPIILFTREISDTGRQEAGVLGAVVIDMDDDTGLAHAVKTLLKV